MGGKLTIVPTPIGNLGDMTPRALDALREADVVCAEDTRVTGKLLAAFGIEGKRLERLDEGLADKRASVIVERVRDGEKIAYCSDAGMPGVSDPGMQLVRAARNASPPIPLEVLPGATAVATAFVASGTTASSFYFGGFFPRKDSARINLLTSLKNLDAALLFYESPKRVTGALSAIAEAFPTRKVTVCRELTKLHEEITRDSAPRIRDDFASRESIKGEIVMVIDPPTHFERDAESEAAQELAANRARQLASAGERPKSIAKTLVEEFGISRNEAYNLALDART